MKPLQAHSITELLDAIARAPEGLETAALVVQLKDHPHYTAFNKYARVCAEEFDLADSILRSRRLDWGRLYQISRERMFE